MGATGLRRPMQVVVHQMANVEVDDDPSNPNIVSTTGTTSTELLAWGGLGQVIDLPAFKLAVRLNGTARRPYILGPYIAFLPQYDNCALRLVLGGLLGATVERQC